MPYNFIETSNVTDEVIEHILNEWTGKGYAFESIQFVTALAGACNTTVSQVGE
jgi:hypothetical protein